MIQPLAFCTAIVVSVLSCTAAQKPLMINKESDGKIIIVNRTRPFTIALPGNASTGFAWHIRDLDTTKLIKNGPGSFVGRDTVPGTSGTFFLGFLPRKKGVSTITLTYHRDFEIDVPPADSFRVTIRVK